MAGTGKKWLVGCGIGCGSAILLVIIVPVILSVFMMRPFDEAIDAQNMLLEQYGEREHYIPPVQGVTADRLEKFLAVRQAVIPLCAEFEEMGSKIKAMDELDKGGDEPSKGEIFTAVKGMTGSIFGLVGNMGDFIQVRNATLLAEGMGLGEYIWIYVIVYHSWLGYEPSSSFEGDGSDRGMPLREKRVLQDLVTNGAEALATAGMTTEAALWKAEVGRMERTETGVPFPDGSLATLQTAVFEPFRQELVSLYCAATSSFEMNQVQKKGLSIRAE